MTRLAALIIGSALAAGNVAAQTVTYAPASRQIAAAITPLPAPLRGSATVLGYDAAGKLVTLRKGSGDMICLSDDPPRPNSMSRVITGRSSRSWRAAESCGQ